MEFHITRRAREKYSFDQSLFSTNGNVIFANFHLVRLFVQSINEKRDLLSFPEQAIKAGQLNAMGLIDEIFHHVFSLYRKEVNPGAIKTTLKVLQNDLGGKKLDAFLEIFISQFPPLAVYRKEISALAYLNGDTEGVQNRESLLEEFILLWISTRNPALESFHELIIDPLLLNDFRFDQVTHILEEHFSKQPKFGPENQSIIDMLRTPSVHVPHSITGQLEYIREHWGTLLGDYLYRLLTSLDLVKEENKLSFMGPGPAVIPLYNRAEFLAAGGRDSDAESFSADRDWMPRLVLIAKNSFVWLDQLSRKYNQPINRLDQIPDVEMEILSQRGITGLWLIGLWERSPASAQIKKLCGNPEAISSAYSLYSYQIAGDLGGEGAYEVLRSQANRFGIRLASDMVPNHMGLDSEWVIYHPERFLSLDHCPFPTYSFNGPDLSTNENVVLQIEDHYYDRTDAAVIFRRIDKRTGQAKYIYHGNDGTSMPWNDTAQLNYLSPEVREAVIQTILEVARKFSVIRFDAAMTLAKKHIQRLWFPQPGSGGAIPTRSEYGLSNEDFDRMIPVEFWREVVDRVAQDVPDTLLLAEAFWLMEGYFVRTLGMHRVYNSAFMNMLRNEDNAGYRKVIKNTLEFEPEILKRFVNFMNNPDERTAVEQFGKGDKYFGICTLLVTMPGLPMIGHGQIEGFSEKYGMEFRRAYWQEDVDQSLVSRHEQEIFPLLHRRDLFAGVENFWMYDFGHSNGGIDENVYAFTNRNNNQCALIFYNNNIDQTSGWIKTSVGQARSKKLIHETINKALLLPNRADGYLMFRDQITGLKYLRPMSEILNRGFSVRLSGYEHHVFLDFEVVVSDAHHDYSRLYALIGENGVPDIQHALTELVLQPILQPFRQIINPGYFDFLFDNAVHPEKFDRQKTLAEFSKKIEPFLDGIISITRTVSNRNIVRNKMIRSLESVLNIFSVRSNFVIPGTKQMAAALQPIQQGASGSKSRWFTLVAWAVVAHLGLLTNLNDPENQTLTWMEEWSFIRTLEEILQSYGFPHSEIQQCTLSLCLAVKFQDWYQKSKNETTEAILKKWFSTPEIQSYVKVNRYNDVLWYNREAFNELLWWMAVIPLLQSQSDEKIDQATIIETVLGTFEIIKKLKARDKKSGYKVEKLVQQLT